MRKAGDGYVLASILTGLLGYQEPSAFVVTQSVYIKGIAKEKMEFISMLASDTVS